MQSDSGNERQRETATGIGSPNRKADGSAPKQCIECGKRVEMYPVCNACISDAFCSRYPQPFGRTVREPRITRSGDTRSASWWRWIGGVR